MTTSTYWERFGHCPTCERTPGAPCRDLRYRGNYALSANRAHHGRPRLATS